MFNVLFLGDIVGQPGREAVMKRVSELRALWHVDVVIANGENAAAGAGINAYIANGLIEAGIDAVTLGDHVWDQRGFSDDIGGLAAVCRPANLPAAAPGRDHLIIEKNGFRLGVFTVLGRNFMGIKAECPFLAADRKLKELAGQCDGIFVEAHMEATSEKIALGWHLDGRALAVVGTHTHVPTADAAVLPKGTAYLSDAGMCGPYASVLGRHVAPVLGRFLDGLPRKFEVASDDVRLSGILIQYDAVQRRCVAAELVCAREGKTPVRYTEISE